MSSGSTQPPKIPARRPTRNSIVEDEADDSIGKLPQSYISRFSVDNSDPQRKPLTPLPTKPVSVDISARSQAISNLLSRNPAGSVGGSYTPRASSNTTNASPNFRNSSTNTNTNTPSTPSPGRASFSYGSLPTGFLNSANASKTNSANSTTNNTTASSSVSSTSAPTPISTPVSTPTPSTVTPAPSPSISSQALHFMTVPAAPVPPVPTTSTSIAPSSPPVSVSVSLNAQQRNSFLTTPASTLSINTSAPTSTPPKFESLSGSYTAYSQPPTPSSTASFEGRGRGFSNSQRGSVSSIPAAATPSSYNSTIAQRGSRGGSISVAFAFSSANSANTAAPVSSTVPLSAGELTNSQMASSLSHRFSDVNAQVEHGIYTTKRIGSFAKKVSHTLNTCSKQLQADLAGELQSHDKVSLDGCESYTGMLSEMISTFQVFSDKLFDFSQRLEMEIVNPMASLQKDTELKRKAIASEELRATSDITKSNEILARQRQKCLLAWSQLSEAEAEAQDIRGTLGLTDKEARELYEKNHEQSNSLSGFFSFSNASGPTSTVSTVKMDDKTRKKLEQRLVVAERRVSTQLTSTNKEFAKCEDHLRAVNVLTQDFHTSVLPRLVYNLEVAEKARLSWISTAFKSYNAMFQDLFDVTEIVDRLNRTFLCVSSESDIQNFISNICSQHGLPLPAPVRRLDLPCPSVSFSNNDWRYVLANPGCQIGSNGNNSSNGGNGGNTSNNMATNGNANLSAHITNNNFYPSLSHESAIEAAATQYNFEPLLPPPIFKVDVAPILTNFTASTHTNNVFNDMITLLPGSYVLITCPLQEAIVRSASGSPMQFDISTATKAVNALSTPYTSMNGSKPIPASLESTVSSIVASSMSSSLLTNSYSSSSSCSSSVVATPSLIHQYSFSHNQSATNSMASISDLSHHDSTSINNTYQKPLNLMINVNSTPSVTDFTSSYDEYATASKIVSPLGDHEMIPMNQLYDHDVLWIGELITPPKSTAVRNSAYAQMSLSSSSSMSINPSTPMLSSASTSNIATIPALPLPTVSVSASPQNPPPTPTINRYRQSISITSTTSSVTSPTPAQTSELPCVTSIGTIPPSALSIVPFDENIPLAYLLYIPCLRRLFLDSLRKEYSYENYDFWETARIFRLTDWNERGKHALNGPDKAHYAGLTMEQVGESLCRKRAKNICDEYIRNEAPRQVNIRGDLQTLLLTAIEDTSIPMHHSIFIDAELEIYNLLTQDSLARFKKSNEFQSYISYVNANSNAHMR